MSANLRPKKHLGQHFLRKPSTATRIASLVKPLPDEHILEIGPGGGILSRPLSELGQPLVAVEFDHEAYELLISQSWPDQTAIIQADFLRYELPSDVNAWCWVGNLPYQITSPILFRMIEERDQVRRGVFMMQREVALRLNSPPGTRNSGILSVLLGAYYTVEYRFELSPDAFRPPPKVWSAVVCLERRSDPPEVDFASLARVVKTAYNQRRKQLTNSLSILDLSLPPELATKRAENLSLADFVGLARQLEG